MTDIAEGNTAFIYLNGEQLPESEHSTFSENGDVRTTGGRVLTMAAIAGDSITLETPRMERVFFHVLTCFEFIPTI